jgi:hypothetical protein
MPRGFLAAAGILFGLIFVKFGNPVIFAKLIPRPVNLNELLLQFWPVDWAYRLLAVLGLLTALFWRRLPKAPPVKAASKVPILCPARRCRTLPARWRAWRLVTGCFVG